MSGFLIPRAIRKSDVKTLNVERMTPNMEYWIYWVKINNTRFSCSSESIREYKVYAISKQEVNKRSLEVNKFWIEVRNTSEEKEKRHYPLNNFAFHIWRRKMKENSLKMKAITLIRSSETAKVRIAKS